MFYSFIYFFIGYSSVSVLSYDVDCKMPSFDLKRVSKE